MFEVIGENNLDVLYDFKKWVLIGICVRCYSVLCLCF